MLLFFLQAISEQDDISGIRRFLGSDFDIINELQQAIKSYGLTLEPKHVKGHQDKQDLLVHVSHIST